MELVICHLRHNIKKITLYVMVGSNEFSCDLRKRIILLYDSGLGYLRVSEVLQVPCSSVKYVVRKWKSHQTYETLHRTGRPSKIPESGKRLLIRKVKCNPFIRRAELQASLESEGISVCKSTISNTLHHSGLQGRVPRKVPLLKKRHVKARLAYAKQMLAKPSEFVDNILWSDETKIELFGQNQWTHVWRRNGTVYSPNNTKPTVKFGSGSIMLWACFSSAGTGHLHIIDGTMSSQMYTEILEQHLETSASLLKLMPG